jgi:hypothetical protein
MRDTDWGENLERSQLFTVDDRVTAPWTRSCTVERWLTDQRSHSYVVGLPDSDREQLMDNLGTVLRTHFLWMVIPHGTIHGFKQPVDVNQERCLLDFARTLSRARPDVDPAVSVSKSTTPVRDGSSKQGSQTGQGSVLRGASDSIWPNAARIADVQTEVPNVLGGLLD